MFITSWDGETSVQTTYITSICIISGEDHRTTRGGNIEISKHYTLHASYHSGAGNFAIQISPKLDSKEMAKDILTDVRRVLNGDQGPAEDIVDDWIELIVRAYAECESS